VPAPLKQLCLTGFAALQKALELVADLPLQYIGSVAHCWNSTEAGIASLDKKVDPATMCKDLKKLIVALV
jgi:hypothetical protein